MTAISALAMRKRHLVTEPHFVYRCFDRDDDIIYVGCTHDVDQRMKQHASTNIGAKTVRLEVTEHPDQRTGLDVERAEIRRFEPLLNRQTWFMDVEAWPQLKILQRLWIDLALHERIPSMDQKSNPVTHLRSVYMDRFDDDPIHLVADVRRDLLNDEIAGVAVPIIRLRLKGMKAYPQLSPSKFV